MEEVTTEFHPEYIDENQKHRSLVFNIWNDCHVGCKFCYSRFPDGNDQLTAAKLILDFLQNTDLSLFNEMQLQGGDFFNGELSDPEVKKVFMAVVDILTTKLQRGEIDIFRFNTSLQFPNRTEFQEVLELIKSKGVLDKCLLCTSYDTIYRFSKKHPQFEWWDNLDWVHEYYPELNTHVEMIVTQDLIHRVLAGELDFANLSKRARSQVDFIEIHTNLESVTSKQDLVQRLPNFLPKRSDFLRFLTKLKAAPTFLDRFLNKSLHAGTCVLVFKNQLYFSYNRDKGTESEVSLHNLIHSSQCFYSYEDSDRSLHEDVIKFKSL